MGEFVENKCEENSFNMESSILNQCLIHISQQEQDSILLHFKHCTQFHNDNQN